MAPWDQATVLAAPENQAGVDHSYDYVKNQREETEKDVTDLGLSVQPGHTSFILVRFPDEGCKTAAQA